MSTNDRIQLKQEEIVGNDVVLTDINPKTNTKSVDDPSTGATLEQTIERIWNALNNKLSRIVNSVNGMTGVVVIDPSTIGLGNVDNVSFADIKEWVISRIMQEMGYKRIEMFDSLQDLDETINTVWNNDEIYANKPFYSRHGYQDDKRGYIGYIYYDDNMLKHTQKALDTVGSADNTIVYNENINDKLYADTGRIGVNIWKYEDALKVYNDLSKSESGLYIDKSKVKSSLYWFDGVYGSGDPADSGALLYYSGSMPSDVHEVTFRIDKTPITYSRPDTQFGGTNYIKQSFEKGDIIICNFNDELYLQEPVGTGVCRTLPIGMNPMLMIRKPAIGMVTQAPTLENPDEDYVIDFYTMKQALFRGLKYETIHTGGADVKSEALSLDLLETLKIDYDNQNPLWEGGYSAPISGINAFFPYDKTYIHQARNYVHKRSFRTVLPVGAIDDIYRTDSDGTCNEKGSMFILPNYSLCVIPQKVFNDNNRYSPKNWPPALVDGLYEPNYDDQTGYEVLNNANSALGVNLVKGLTRYSVNDSYVKTWATNLSGLRIDDDTSTLQPSWFGNDDSAAVQYHSGGLSVNVGEFLEIGSTDGSNAVEQTRDDYYEEGKVNVRVDKTKGLYNVPDISDNPTNKLGINIANGTIYQSSDNDVSWIDGGLYFVDGGVTVPNHGLLGVNTAHGLSGLVVHRSFTNKAIYNGTSTPSTEYSTNVLGVKPYRFYKNISTPGIEVGGIGTCVDINICITAEELGQRIRIPNLFRGKQWKSLAALQLEYNADPSKFDEDHVYFAGKQYYIVASGLTSGNFTNYFAMYDSQEEYDEVLDNMRSGEDLISRRRSIVLIKPDTTIEGRYQVRISGYFESSLDRRIPDVNNDGQIDSTDSSTIRTIYAETKFPIYHQGGIYYTDEECTQVLVPEDGVWYVIANETIDNYNIHPIREGYQGNLRYPILNGLELTDVLYARADADRDGVIDGSDSSCVLEFYAVISTGEYAGDTVENAWYKFLTEYKGIYVDPAGDPIAEVYSFYYEPGVRVRYNTYKGLTTDIEYVLPESEDIETISTNDRHNELAIKIADRTAGFSVFDLTKCGGLRFNTGGYLGIRINNNNSFSAVERNKHEGLDEITQGIYGLHIFDGNILGVQLAADGSTDNGDLYFDRYGCLKISPNFVPLKHKLTFKGVLNGTPNHTFDFDGSEDTTIELGPGLCFVE